MFEYQAEQVTRRRYNFESPIFSLSADSDYCLDFMQSFLSQLNAQQLNTILCMVDLDCLDSFPSIEEIVSAIEMFNYSEQDILDRLNSTSEFIFEDDFAY